MSTLCTVQSVPLESAFDNLSHASQISHCADSAEGTQVPRRTGALSLQERICCRNGVGGRWKPLNKSRKQKMVESDAHSDIGSE